MTRKIPDEAFEEYVAMGPGRSYQGLAERHGVTKRAVAKVASGARWSERLAGLEQEAQKRADERLVESMCEMRERHHKTVKAMHARALSALREYPLTSCMEAMKAAEMAIKLERLLVGEASERTATTVEEATRREVHRWMLSPEVEEDHDAGEAAQAQ